jgi:peptidoglycan/xylan/chitin deacetylase (PgdA/CDA1 family)
VFDKFVRKASRFYYAKPHLVSSKRSIITFTFDDFPLSAYEIGARILEAYEARGTYYTSALLAESCNDGLLMYQTENLLDLQSTGHEIGCHTHHHVGLQGLDNISVTKQLDDNYDFLRPYLGDHGLTSFSYPFGHVSFASKKIISGRFATGRGISSGVNQGIVDLSQLKANAIYSHKDNLDDLEKLIYSVVRSGGWLIFYTHDVSDSPSAYGCTPEVFEQIVKLATSDKCEVLCMRHALSRAIF